MTKKPLLTSGALGITILLFNIFFFLLKEDLSLANTTLWISYGFLHFSAFAAIVVTFLPPQNVTYRFSLSSLSMVYFILEFLCGSFFMVFDGIHYKISLLVQLVLLAVCGIAALFFSTVNRTTEKQLNNDKQNKNVIHHYVNTVKELKIETENPVIKNQLQRLEDALFSCSITKASTVTLQLEQSLPSLRNAVYTNTAETANKIIEMIVSKIV